MTVTTGVLGGKSYGFRYRAKNRQGIGAYSDTAYFKAVNVPDQMVPAIISETGVNVRIEWIAPNSGSLPIVSYLIEIMTADSENYAETSSCNGTDSYIISNMFCTVPMSNLTTSPFNLTQGELIRVRLSAKNSLGFGIASTLNTVGVLAKQKPHKPLDVP